MKQLLAGAIVCALLAGCGTVAKKPSAPLPSKPSASSAPKPGAYYQDDGPGANPPPNLESIPDAVPRAEKYHSGSNKPYTVFGKSYVPQVNDAPFRQTGIATWYGRKYHGNMTSMGEIYDMYGMTAAHTTLPLPSYVRVTNPTNGKSVIVRVNDRGPFHPDRIIDLSYTAAVKLDIARKGSQVVAIERVFPGEKLAAPAPQPAPTVSPPPLPAPTSINVSPIVPEGNRLYIQMGAFSSEQNADVFRARLVRELDWYKEPITVAAINNLWRVRLGPFATRTEADAIVERIKSAHDFSPVIARQ